MYRSFNRTSLATATALGLQVLPLPASVAVALRHYLYTTLYTVVLDSVVKRAPFPGQDHPMPPHGMSLFIPSQQPRINHKLLIFILFPGIPTFHAVGRLSQLVDYKATRSTLPNDFRPFLVFFFPRRPIWIARPGSLTIRATISNCLTGSATLHVLALNRPSASKNRLVRPIISHQPTANSHLGLCMMLDQ